MESDPTDPLLDEESKVKLANEEEFQRDTYQRATSIIPGEFRFSSNVPGDYIKSVVQVVDNENTVVKILLTSENTPIAEEKEGEDKDDAQEEDNQDGAIEDDNAQDDNKDEEKEMEELNQELKKKYSKFLRWKVFENVFKFPGKLSLFDVDKTGKNIAFKINNEHLIKIITLDSKHKQFTIKENPSCPVEFLKFISQEKLIIANRLFLFIANVKDRTIKRFNLLEKYNGKQVPMDEITSKIAKNYGAILNANDLMFYFTISKIIYSFKIPDINKKEFKLKYIKASDSIQEFFADTKKRLLFVFSLIDTNEFILETFDLLSLKLKAKHKINGFIKYFSPPIILESPSEMQIKFIFHVDTDLKYLSYSIPKIDLSKSEGKIVEETNSELADSVLEFVNDYFRYDFEILKVDYAFSDMAIINTKPASSIDSSSADTKQSIYDSKLLRPIKPFDTPFDKIIVKSPVMFTYRDNILYILTLGMNAFEGELEFTSKIISVTIVLNVIFVECEDSTECWKIILDKKTRAPCKYLDDSDIEKLKDLDPDVKNSLLDILCYGRDSKSLNKYLNTDGFKNDDDIDTLNIKRAIDSKSKECLKVLFDYFINLEIDPQKLGPMLDDIEDNFQDILSSGASNLIPFLNKLLQTEVAIGEPYNQDTPDFQFVESKTESLGRVFFNQNTTEGNEYAISSTLIKLPIVPGSHESVELAYHISNYDGLEIYKSTFIKYYIQARWKELWGIVFVQTLIIWINCLFVILLVADDKNSLFYQTCFLSINCLLLFSETLQMRSLGFTEYIGIENIHFLGNAAFGISIAVLVTGNFYLSIPYAILQLLSLVFESEQKKILILIRTIPYVAYFLCYPYTSSIDVYAFIIIASYELIHALFLFRIGLKGKFGRGYLKITAALLFLGYGYDS